MGYAVLHLDKAPGNEAAMTAHIARTKIPTNASPERTCLNEELVEFPEEVADRTEAISYRLEHAGRSRARSERTTGARERVMLSHDAMNASRSSGGFRSGVSIAWLETFGAENVVRPSCIATTARQAACRSHGRAPTTSVAHPPQAAICCGMSKYARGIRRARPARRRRLCRASASADIRAGGSESSALAPRHRRLGGGHMHGSSTAAHRRAAGSARTSSRCFVSKWQRRSRQLKQEERQVRPR